MSERPNRFADRLFFALRPDAAATARIEAARDRLRTEQALLSPLKAETPQITLHHLGDFVRFPQELADKAVAAAATLAAPAFSVDLDQAMSLKRREAKVHPLVLLPSEEALVALKGFHAQLVASLKAAGIYRYASFTPHLPLLHDVIAVEHQAIEPVRWTASEFLLVNDRLGKAEEIVLGRWPLQQP